MKKCYICNSEMLEKVIEIQNSWGNKSKSEKVTAWVCTNLCCEEIIYSGKEAKRLQELAKKY